MLLFGVCVCTDEKECARVSQEEEEEGDYGKDVAKWFGHRAYTVRPVEKEIAVCVEINA